MTKEHITFRIDPQTKMKLDQLLLMENEKAKNLGKQFVDRTSIINKAIETLYLSRMEDANGDLMSEKMLEAVEKSFQKNLPILVNAINGNRFDTMMILEYERLLCKGLKYDEEFDGYEQLLYTEMPWDTAIPKKVKQDLEMKEKENVND